MKGGSERSERTLQGSQWDALPIVQGQQGGAAYPIRLQADKSALMGTEPSSALQSASRLMAPVGTVQTSLRCVHCSIMIHSILTGKQSWASCVW